MKNGSFLFLGLLAALVISWASIVLGSNATVGAIAPYYDDTDSQTYPLRLSGQAAQGQLVYRSLDCAACHTQQVRRQGFGNDIEHGWGTRQSVARDYIYQPAVQLGSLRLGPDLANFAARKPTPDEKAMYRLLYNGAPGMPSYRFLFEQRKVVGQVADDALAMNGLPAGEEIVPTAKARSLAAYLLSLNSAYDYPEAKPVAPAAGEKEGAKK